MTEEIPQWAKERACELVNERAGVTNWYARYVGDSVYPALTVLARYIAQHEQPPVDPDLEKAREICARVAEEIAADHPAFQVHYRDGRYDDDPEVQFALSALKEARG